MTAYYNEIDPKAAAWLRVLIAEGHIADGYVDERSIIDVKPEELEGYTQCHFFAGVGVWSHSLRLAGWPDDAPVWTGSCPCQPFSVAGKGGGTEDERHLWPEFFRLIQECRPDVVFGEQVASKDARTWLDSLQDDMEGEDYAVGSASTVACGFGAPHKRQRIYWVGSMGNTASPGLPERGQQEVHPSRQEQRSKRPSPADAMADSGRIGAGAEESRPHPREPSNSEGVGSGSGDGHSDSGDASQLGDSSIGGGGSLDGKSCQGDGQKEQDRGPSVLSQLGDSDNEGSQGREIGRDGPDEQLTRAGGLARQECGPVNGFWGDADWLGCRDGKWRPVEPGTFPLVDGAPARVGLLRGYGNAIVAEQAKAFIEAYMDSMELLT